MAFPARQKRVLDRQPPDGVRLREGARDAFTAVELMVAVAVLAMMITMVSMILASSKRLVSTSQAIMRANSTASAITETIRDDLRRASKNGLLCITKTGPAPDDPIRLVLAVPGTVTSLTSNVRGSGEFICYGLVVNDADPADPNNRILFRVGRIMSEDAAAPPDVMANSPFSVLRLFSRVQIDAEISNQLGSFPSNGLRIPPVTLTDINNIWQIASAHCSDLTIMWSDGTVSVIGGTLEWYGPGSPKVAGWQSRDINDNEIEFDAHGNDTYRALWTQHNQSNWPKAVKFRFRLRDPDMPAEFSNVDYEVVCPIGQ